MSANHVRDQEMPFGAAACEVSLEWRVWPKTA